MLEAMHHPLRSFVVRGLFVAAAMFSSMPPVAVADPVVRGIPADAGLGWLEIGVFPDARIDGRPARFGAGARILGAANTSVAPASVQGRVLIAYQRDFQGLVSQAWLITSEEASALRAARRR